MALPNSIDPWQPPPDFQQVESPVEGVTVYAPVSQAPAEQERVAFKCPQCGATTRYDVSAGGVACEHCGYVAPTTAEEVGRQAEEFEFTLSTWEQAQQGWGVERRELHCDSCGASISLPEGTLSVSCPFCASNEVHIGVAPENVLRPRFLIPFKVTADNLKEKTKEWLGQGWYHPSELSSAAVLDRFVGIYIPFWTFDADITASWSAQVGYPRTERYYDAGSKSWKSRTVIDWRWENGRVRVHIDDLLLTGSTRLSRRILEALYPFYLENLVGYSPEYLAGWQAQAYDLTLPDAWEEGKAQMRDRAREVCYDDIPTSHVRNFSMTADFGEESWRYILLPVYLAAYNFEGKTFQVMVNGQTGVIAGQKPVEWWKIWAAIAAMLAPGALVSLVSLPLVLLNGVGLFGLLLGIILLVIGGAFSVMLYRNAIASEAA